MTQKHLRDAVRGPVLMPGDEDFEQACVPWNLTVRQSAAAVVDAVDAEDVVAVVRWAREAGLTVVAQATGHGASGNHHEAILLRTGRLNRIDIDPRSRLARVDAGVLWTHLQAAAAEQDLTGLAGSTGGVSVVGYTLGGGLSWFGRKFGWAADAVRTIYLVDAEGQFKRVTANSDPDLFWALRGGGGDFGIVTSLEFDLFPAPYLYGGRMFWSSTHTSAVFDAYREITAAAPEELSLWFHRLHTPDGPLVALDVAYLGDTVAARTHLTALDRIADPLNDTLAPMSVADLGDIAAEPTDPSPALWRTEFLTDLGEAVEKVLLDHPMTPLIDIQLRHLGGALARTRPDSGARGSVAEPYLLYMFGLGLPHLRAAVADKQQELVDALGAHVAGTKPYTLLTPGESAARAFAAGTAARLAHIKHTRDPHRLFQASYPVGEPSVGSSK